MGRLEPDNAASSFNDVRQVFRTWDKNGKGLISRKDLCRILRKLSPEIREQELECLFEAAAVTEGDSLNYDNFFAWLWSFSHGGAGEDAESRAQGEEIDLEVARARGLWEGEIHAARLRAMGSYPAERVERYFDELQARLGGQEYADHVKGAFFRRVDKNEDGKVDFHEAVPLIKKSLQCAADLGGAHEPMMDEIRAAFDAHDTLMFGWGRMGDDEFLNLARYLQVRVAEAMLPLSQIVQGGD